MWEGWGARSKSPQGFPNSPQPPPNQRPISAPEGPCLQRPNKNSNLLNLNAGSIFGQSPPSVVSRVSQVRSIPGSSLEGVARRVQQGPRVQCPPCHLQTAIWDPVTNVPAKSRLWGSADRSTCQGQWPLVLEDTRVAQP